MAGGGAVLPLKCLAGADKGNPRAPGRAAQQVGNGQAGKEVAGGAAPGKDDVLWLSEHGGFDQR